MTLLRGGICRVVVGFEQGFDSAAKDAGEGLKGDRGGAVDVLGALLVLLDVADVDVRAGGEFALGESGGEALAAKACVGKGAADDCLGPVGEGVLRCLVERMVETDDIRGRERGEDFREGARAFPLVEGEDPSAPVFRRPSHRVNAWRGPPSNLSAA